MEINTGLCVVKIHNFESGHDSWLSSGSNKSDLGMAGSSSMAKIYKNVSGAKNAVKYYRTHFPNYEYTIYSLYLGEKIDY